MADAFAFLKAEHPVYTAQKALWQQNERRFLGPQGGVLDELTKFDWEIENGPHHTERKRNATYLNWPDRFATLLVGHLMRQAPKPEESLDFGTLGQVRRLRDLNNPSRAELLYYNTDGVGNDGSEWDNFWTGVARKAVVFGHMWVLAEGPPEAPGVFARELQGLRPYLTEYSPLDVVNWGFQAGRLAFAVIRRAVRRPRVEEGALAGNEGEDQWLLLTRRGFTDFGPQFSAGGWFMFNADLEGEDFGIWDATEGEIPMVALYYERVKETRTNRTISRPGVTELGNLAVSYMNLCSAADFDAWDGASSVQAVLGVDAPAFNLFVNKIKKGNRYAPLPLAGEQKLLPDIKDASTGAVTSDVFDTRLAAKRTEAIELMLNELHSAPYASGESKQVSWTDSKAPRLAIFAGEIEGAQNAMIHFLEQLWGNKRPTGATEWRREFDLIDVISAATEFFQIRAVAGIRSPTLEAKIMVAVAQSKGWVTNNEEKTTIMREYQESATAIQRIEETPKPAPGTGGAAGGGAAVA